MIFRIYQDRRYQTFMIDDDDICAKLGDQTTFHMDRTPCAMSELWQPIKINFYSDRKSADIPDITEANGKLFLSSKAANVMEPLISQFGELLPIEYENGKGFLFNCLTNAEQVKGVDLDNSKDDIYTGESFLTFFPEKVKALNIFNTEFDSYLGLFCQEAFKECIEKNQLKGVVFGQDLGKLVPPDGTAMEATPH